MEINADDFGGSNIEAAPKKAPPKKPVKKPVQKAAAPVKKESDRVRIILEEGEHIAPTGQFFGLNGRGYIIRPGEPVSIPRELLGVIHDAVSSMPIRDAANNVVGYRDKMRFPYRFA